MHAVLLAAANVFHRRRMRRGVVSNVAATRAGPGSSRSEPYFGKQLLHLGTIIVHTLSLHRDHIAQKMHVRPRIIQSLSPCARATVGTGSQAKEVLTSTSVG